jgi:hypothetical protein
MLEEVMGHAAEERGFGFVASAGSGDNGYCVGALGYCEHRFGDASVGLFDERVGGHTGGTQAPGARLRGVFGALDPLSIALCNLIAALVPKAEP